MTSSRSAIVIAASSDIGANLCKHWRGKGWKVAGTFRSASPNVEELQRTHNVELFPCDLLNPDSIKNSCSALANTCPNWDVLTFAPGLQDPIGFFEQVDFEKWEQGVNVNLLKPLEILHRLLPYRNREKKPTVLFFAGGGTNNAVVRYSSYTLSKIALIKMCELLDAEMPDTRFVIVGPGWVKTKIHVSTVNAKEAAGANFHRTLEKFQKGDWIPMEKVVECCTYLVTTPCDAISGRNFSVASDSWGTIDLEQALISNPEMYKLKRHLNDWEGT